MRSNFLKILSSLALLSCLVGVTGQTNVLALELSLPGTQKTDNSEKKDPLSYIQLRNLLMDFADRYSQMIGQASDTLQKENTDPGARVGIHSVKLFPSSAAFSIAIDSNPHMALLDMVVLVHLQGSVWKETLPKRFNDKAAALLGVEKTLEDDIDSIALRAMGPEQLEQLKTLVEEWRKENPDQRYVSYIRFADFSELHGSWQRSKTPNLLSISGLLSTFQLVNMDETTRSVDQARMLGERAIYLSQRMPTLIRWQSEMLFYEMSSTPETKNLMATTKAIRDFPSEMHRLIWEAAAAAFLIIFSGFIFGLLYKKISKKI